MGSEMCIRDRYKTRGGYERLTLAKHSQDSRGAATPFSNSLLEGTVAIAVGNINAAGVFAENLRKELSSMFTSLFQRVLMNIVA